MPFASDAALTSTIMNNLLRGYHRNNSDTALTGTTSETDLKSVTISANTVGATGQIEFFAAGTGAGTAGTHTLRVYWGGTAIVTFVISAANGADDWLLEGKIINTSTGAQRLILQNRSAHASNGTLNTTIVDFYSTQAIDTTQNQILKVTGQLASAADTITQTLFEVFVVQIT